MKKSPATLNLERLRRFNRIKFKIKINGKLVSSKFNNFRIENYTPGEYHKRSFKKTIREGYSGLIISWSFNWKDIKKPGNNVQQMFLLGVTENDEKNFYVYNEWYARYPCEFAEHFQFDDEKLSLKFLFRGRWIQVLKIEDDIRSRYVEWNYEFIFEKKVDYFLIKNEMMLYLQPGKNNEVFEKKYRK